MGLMLAWQSGSDGSAEMWLCEDSRPTVPLLRLASPGQRQIVEHWAAQADSLPEFLEMLHLEGLIDLETLRRLLAEHSPLHRIWGKLRAFCQLAGDIGEYPVHRIVIGPAGAPLPERAIRLPEQHVARALEAWARFEAGDDAALQSPSLGVVLSELGFLAGTRLRLTWSNALHFGDWLSQLITNRTLRHGNDAEILRLGEIAAFAAYGTTQTVGRACFGAEVWDRYRPGIAAVVRALQVGL